MGDGGESTVKTSKPINENGFSLSNFWNKLVCKDGTEAAAFDLVWKITARDKGFKVAFYPGLAYLFIFFFITVFKSGRGFESTWMNLPASNSFLWLVYLPTMISTTAIYVIPMYENFTAAWIYNSAPVKTPGNLVSAAAKVVLTKFFFPIYVVMFAFAYYVWGYKILDDFLLGFVNNSKIQHVSKLLFC